MDRRHLVRVAVGLRVCVYIGWGCSAGAIGCRDGAATNALAIAVPPNAVSLAIDVRAAPHQRIAIAELTLADGVPRVAPWNSMDWQAARRSARLPGLPQVVRDGEFRAILAAGPNGRLPEGPGRLRVATDPPWPRPVVQWRANVTLGNTLVLRLIAWRNALLPSSRAIAKLAALFATADVTLWITARTRVMDGPAAVTQATFPHETPTSEATLAVAQFGLPATSMIDVYLVESLPPGVAGLSLGTPAGPVASQYRAVIVRARGDEEQLARAIAHEVGHALGLLHPRDGAWSDTLTDTARPNIMSGDGDRFTSEQAWIMQTSGLLLPEGAPPANATP